MSSYQILTFYGDDPTLEPYKAMLFSDFMKSLRYGNELYKLMDSDRYFKAYEQVISNILNKSRGIVRLACLTEDLDTCLGWSITEEFKLHYVFVKRDQRKQGIATSLMPKEFRQVTHLTKIGQAIRKSKFPNIPFDPFS